MEQEQELDVQNNRMVKVLEQEQLNMQNRRIVGSSSGQKVVTEGLDKICQFSMQAAMLPICPNPQFPISF